MKMSGQKVTWGFLCSREERAVQGGYRCPRYVDFCRNMLMRNYHVTLYEARTTVSKYVTVSSGEKTFLVRFSNHKPNRQKEQNKDCDFFVGITHLGVTTTEDAIKAAVAALA